MLKLTTRLELTALGFLLTLLGLQFQDAMANPVNQYNNRQPVDIIIDAQPQPPNPSPSQSSRPSASQTPSRPGNTPQRTSSIDPRFTCQLYNGQYTVMYRPLSQPGQAYPWAVPRSLGDGWTAQRRCQEISQRLEQYRPDGLAELSTGYENGYQTICATTEAVPRCRIVLTVPPGQSAEVIRDRIFESLTVADSGQMTQGVSALQGNSGNFLNQLGQLFNQGKKPATPNPATKTAGINLKPFLDTQDGGTGQKLSQPSQPNAQPDFPDFPDQPTQSQPPKRLNSNQFR